MKDEDIILIISVRHRLDKNDEKSILSKTNSN